MKIDFKYPKFLEEAIEDTSKYVCIPAGRRTGKTYNFTQWILEQMLDPDIEWDFNPMGLWVDTSQGNIDKYVDMYFKPILRDVWGLCHYRSDKKILKLFNKIPIIFGSAERPELLEGFQYPRAVLNEAGIILKKPSLWDNTLQPMFKGKDTKVKIIGTPKGKNKYFDLTLRHKTYHFTCYDSPYWNKDELDYIKTQTPEIVWKQEYLAEFVQDEGSVFRNIRSCINNYELNKGLNGSTYVMAVDLAKHQDFTVILVGDVNTKQVVYKERFNQIDWTFQKQRIINAWNNFNRCRIIIDATGAGNPIYDDLHNAGLNIEPFIFTPASKKEIIWDLAIAIDNQSIKYPEWLDLLNELESFEYQMNRSGSISYSAPIGLHDDCVVALAMLNKLIKSNVIVNLTFI